MSNEYDLSFHMNNGHYRLFMDVGQARLMRQTGLLKIILAQNECRYWLLQR
jgi:acyl-CoA thioesterase FadM